MRLNQQLTDELSVLTQFNLSTTQEGIKVHSDADTAVIEATQRLFEKGLITQADGGYLTDLGHEAAQHADSLISILTTA